MSTSTQHQTDQIVAGDTGEARARRLVELRAQGMSDLEILNALLAPRKQRDVQ